MRPALVGIVVVHYTGLADTIACLESVSRLTYPSFFVYLVDQGSGDASPQTVAHSFPQIEVILSRENLGYAGGSNLGIRAALADGADYILLLNNDVTVAPDLLDRMAEFFSRNPAAGIAGPMVLRMDQPETVWAMGGAIDWRGQSRLLSAGSPLDDTGLPARDQSRLDFVVGCGMLIKRQVFEQVGCLDERFFLYYEEADFCARARKAGFSLGVAPAARMWHKGSGAAGTSSDLTLYYMRRNILLYLAKRGNPPGYAAALIDSLRLLLVWKLQRKPQQMQSALWRALRDALLGRWGRAELFG